MKICFLLFFVACSGYGRRLVPNVEWLQSQHPKLSHSVDSTFDWRHLGPNRLSSLRDVGVLHAFTALRTSLLSRCPVVASNAAFAKSRHAGYYNNLLRPVAQRSRLRSQVTMKQNSEESKLLQTLVGVAPAALYFGIGVAVYALVEGWSPLDALYFLMVTATTVGYGDLAPASDIGKVFTGVYALFGTALILDFLSPVVSSVLVPLRSKIDSFVPLAVDTSDLSLTLAEVNRQISYPRRYLRAVIGPIILMILGALYAGFELKLGVVDSIYWSTITMTTIGFGDISPAESPAAKLFAIAYLPLVVTALADAFKSVSDISSRRSIREADQLAILEEMIFLASNGDPYKSVTETEFLVSTLVKNNCIDEATLVAVRRQYASLVSEDEELPISEITDNKLMGGDGFVNESHVLDARAIYNQLKRLGKLSDEDFECGYHSWFEHVWKARVLAGPSGNDTAEGAFFNRATGEVKK